MSLVVGVDLAWGERRSDGVCVVRVRGSRAAVVGYASPHGDDELVATLASHLSPREPALLAIDAPIVCRNATGARPVDVLMHRLFHREHAGCHPANLTTCPRPARLLSRLAGEGFVAGTDLREPRLAAEVYPHAALVRFLGLPRIVKYKRGPAAERRAEFARLQQLLGELLSLRFAFVAPGPATRALLAAPWTKDVEDRVDALVCALVGLWHVHHRGRLSDVLGDLESGFLLLPRTAAQAAL